MTISTLTAPKRFPRGIKIGRLCDGNDRPGHDSLTSGRDRAASGGSERMHHLRGHLLDRIGVMPLGKLLVGKI